MDGRTDRHHHTIIRPVWRRAYKNGRYSSRTTKNESQPKQSALGNLWWRREFRGSNTVASSHNTTITKHLRNGSTVFQIGNNFPAPRLTYTNCPPNVLLHCISQGAGYLGIWCASNSGSRLLYYLIFHEKHPMLRPFTVDYIGMQRGH